MAGGALSLFAAAAVALTVLTRWVPTLVSAAVGAMLAAAFLDLLPEAFRLSADVSGLFATVLIGIVSLFVLEKLALWRHHHTHGASASDPRARAALLILVGHGVHNFVDGVYLPDFLENVSRKHDDDVTSFVFRDIRPFELGRLETFLSVLIQIYSRDMLRHQGALHVHDDPRLVLFRGMRMIMGTDEGKPWGLDEHRESKMVFIGRKRPRDLFEKGLALRVHGAAESPPTG